MTSTSDLWAEYGRHAGDRHGLFSAISDVVSANEVLYPGSFIDIAASFVFPSVTYVDVDRRARRFFADADGVDRIISTRRTEAGVRRFIAGDYRQPLDIDDGYVDLLVSLYAGFVSEHCTRYLRVGGALLVNPSHGDAAMASIDDRYELHAVVHHRSEAYRVSTDELGTYLVPKRDEPVTVDRLHELGRGIAYTRPAFAYLFRRTS